VEEEEQGQYEEEKLAELEPGREEDEL